MKTFARYGALAITFLFVACSGAAPNGATAGGNGADITIAGSTALLPLVKQAAQDYQSAHADVKISVSGGGSRVGLTQVASKGVDIGDSDIPAPPGQHALVDHRVAVATFAVIVHPSAGVKRLTRAQIQHIFSGALTNWNQAGGSDQKITIINRPKSSGTRAVFVDTVMQRRQPTENGLTEDSSGTVVTTVAQTPGAVSYVSTGYLKGRAVNAVAIDGVTPAESNVTSGKYAFWSYEHMYTNGQPAKSVADFIAYVSNDTPILHKLGFTRVDQMSGQTKRRP